MLVALAVIGNARVGTLHALPIWSQAVASGSFLAAMYSGLRQRFARPAPRLILATEDGGLVIGVRLRPANRVQRALFGRRAPVENLRLGATFQRSGHSDWSHTV